MPCGVGAGLAAAGLVALPAARNIKVIAFNPGLMLDTNFVAGISSVAGFFARTLGPLILPLTSAGRFARNPKDSGLRLARLAHGNLVGDATAAFVSDDDVIPTSAFSLSLDGATRAQQELWAHSLRWAHVTEAELAQAGMPVRS